MERFKRNCPTCGVVIEYTTYRQVITANKNQTQCCSCRRKNSSLITIRKNKSYEIIDDNYNIKLNEELKIKKFQFRTKCNNPNNNPNCIGISAINGNVCASCQRYGKSYNEIYGVKRANEKKKIVSVRKEKRENENIALKQNKINNVCKNPNNNPKCVEKVFTHDGLCRSCMRFGKSYDEIFGKENVDRIKLIQKEKLKLDHKLHPEKYKNNYLHFNIQHKSIYDIWVEKYGKDIADKKWHDKYEFNRSENNAFKHLTIESRIKQVESRKKSKPLWEDKHKEATTKNNQRKEFREHKSEVLSRKISNGEFNPFSHHKHGYYISKSGENCYYQSLWELARMIQLDDLNIKWNRKHGIRIKYLIDGVVHHYTPDLLVNDTVIEEIKPSALISYNQEKIKYAMRYCKYNNFEFRIITETDIDNYLEIADRYYNNLNKLT